MAVDFVMKQTPQQITVMQWQVTEFSLKNIGKKCKLKLVVRIYLADLENTYLKFNLNNLIVCCQRVDTLVQIP